MNMYLEQHVIAKERHRESAIGGEKTTIRDLLHRLTNRQNDRGVGERHDNVLISHLLTTVSKWRLHSGGYIELVT
jgi:hypothetical protein